MVSDTRWWNTLIYNLNCIPNQVWEHGYFWEWLGVTRDTKVAFGIFPYFPYHTETFWYGMVWEWYGKRNRFPIPYHTVVRHSEDAPSEVKSRRRSPLIKRLELY